LAKKPTLKLVQTTAQSPSEPPRTLGEPGLTLWQTIMTEYEIADSGGREMLLQACSALDRAEACAEHIRNDGEIVRTKTGPKDHPALKHELANRAFVVRTLARLGLDVQAIKPTGRPPGFRA
jgi:hypothetical protein